MMVSQVWRAAAALWPAFVMVLAGACGPDSDRSAPAPPAGWPDKLSEFTVVWSSEPGINLANGPAVVVRAYTESYELANAMGDNKYLYPGFKASVEAGPAASNQRSSGDTVGWHRT